MSARRARTIAAALLLGAALLLAGCATARPTGAPTAVAAANSPVPPSATPAPPTETPLPPSDTPIPPTDTPVPTATPLPPTDTLTPTATPLPPTDTPAPTATPTATRRPTRAPTAKPRPTATPTRRAYAKPVLLGPDPDFVCYKPPPRSYATCDFRWSWAGTLQPDQYFQVQIVGENNEHWGVHAPTKETSYTYVYPKWGGNPFRDICKYDRQCKLKWTVVVVEWDGKDTKKLGRVLSEAEPRFVYW